MASIRKRTRRDDTAYYGVRWLQGGRDGARQAEKFGDETAAEECKNLVDAHGRQWPPGWTKGKGFVEEPTAPGAMPFLDWAHRYAPRLTGIDERVRYGHRRDIDTHRTPGTWPTGSSAPACAGVRRPPCTSGTST